MPWLELMPAAGMHSATASAATSTCALLIRVTTRVLLVDLIGVLRPPFQPDTFAFRFEYFLRRRLEVLPDDDELAAGVQVDDVAGDHPDVDDVADHSRLALAADALDHVDLLRTNRESPAVALEHVRDADEPGDELGRRMLVHVGRAADLL